MQVLPDVAAAVDPGFAGSFLYCWKISHQIFIKEGIK